MCTGFIYCVISPSSKKYYGKSIKNVEKIKKRHYKKSLTSGCYFSTAIKKYGIDNFEWKKIETYHFFDKNKLQNKLNEREIFWIAKDKTNLKKYGYNMTKGGDGGDTISNHPNKQKIIKKIIKANKGRKRSIEIRMKFSKIQKEIYLNLTDNERKERIKPVIESRKKRIKTMGFTKKELAAQQKNKEHLIKYNKSKEGREQVSKRFKGKKKPPFSEEHRRNIGKASKGRKIPGKKVIIMNIIYESLHEATRKLEIPLSTLKNRLLNKNFENWNYYRIKIIDE